MAIDSRAINWRHAACRTQNSSLCSSVALADSGAHPQMQIQMQVLAVQRPVRDRVDGRAGLPANQCAAKLLSARRSPLTAPGYLLVRMALRL